MENRLQYINLLRLLATVSVIFIHVGSLLISSQGLERQSPDFMFYEWCHQFFSFAVPVFVLISGSLLLDPAKEISYQKVFRKYTPRIVLALIIFGSLMCLAEAYTTRTADEGFLAILFRSAVNLLTGRSWAHMWYLYMLLGLYALTPLYKAFVNQSSPRDLHCLIGVLAVMCVVMPYLKITQLVPFEGYIMLPVFLFLYPFGYYISVYLRKGRTSCIVSLAVLVFYAFHVYYCIKTGFEFRGYDIPTVLAAAAVFHLGSFFTMKKSDLLENMSRHCFCIYIIHAVFLNAFFKVLHVENFLNAGPLGNVLIVVSATFALSYAASSALRSIPFLRKRVL
ncbi:MAG: acyltransferase family protein [Prevotella sp.]|nr:acyltransferase family protein [Prevotella sp.]